MLPFIQLETDFLTVKSRMVAAVAGVDQTAAIGFGAQLFAFAVAETSTDEKPPDGLFLDPDAPAVLEAMLGWAGESGRLVAAFIRAGCIEKLEIGLRVRGMDRYLEAWVGTKERTEKAQKAAKARWDARRNAQAEPEQCSSNAQASSEQCSDDAWRCQYRDGDGDGDPLPTEEVGELALSAPPSDPVERLQSAWNTLAPEPLPRWLETGTKRRRHAKSRLRERPLPQWEAIIRRIGESPFCRGENDRGWVASPDWLLQPETAAKVLEGKYDARGTGPPGRPKPLTDADRVAQAVKAQGGLR